MVDVPPTFQNPYPPSLRSLLDELKREVMKNLNCARVGVIQSYDAGAANRAPTVTVKIAQQQVTSIDPQDVRTIAEYPLLLQVPVFFPSGGGYTLTFPIAAGDECIVIFNDREIDNWLHAGAGQAPTTGRVHDLSDGMALVGIRSNPRALSNISASAVQLRSDNYTNAAGTGEAIEISPGKIQINADEVNVHARNKLTYDAGGTGYVIVPNHLDNYTQGVPGTDHPPTPPEVPT